MATAFVHCPGGSKILAWTLNLIDIKAIPADHAWRRQFAEESTNLTIQILEELLSLAKTEQ